MKRTVLTILAGIICLTACDEGDLTKQNPNQLVLDTFYVNEDELSSGVNAIYARMVSTSLFSREYWFLHDLRGDDNTSGGGQLETARNQLLIGSHDVANAVMTNVWLGIYQLIHRANIIIENGPETADISEEARSQLIAEAKCARGWAYYELGTLWGGAPIYTDVADALSEVNPRATQAEVLAQATRDLEEAAADLAPQSATTDLGRFTQGAAWALLGRVHMFNGEYDRAKTVLENIVNSGEYALVDEYDDNFQEEAEFNSESIWEISFADVGNFNWDRTGDGIGNEQSVRSQEYSAIGWRNLIPSPELLDEFERPEKGDEKRDPRLDKSFYFTGDLFNNGTDTLSADAQRGNALTFNGEEQKVSWRKYSIMYKVNPGGFLLSAINHRVIRYAEVLLNLAECEVEVGTEAQAIAYLNMVRARPSVDMPPYPTANYPVDSREEIIRAIIHEKRVEMSSEQIRNRDIIRWRKEGKLAEEPLAYFTPNKFELLPIPQDEINNNPLINQADQNPGY